MPFNPLKPYNDLPPLPPRADFETKEVLKKAIAAGRSIGELKGLGGLIPNQSMLVNTLILQEARASSEIENIITTNDALFRALTAGSADIDPATKEVLRYREALWTGFEALEKKPRITTALCVAAAQTLTGDSRGIRNQPGTVIANRATGAVIYTPPDGKSLILKKLKELEKFIHADNGIEPLVKLALMHYQFETIHPFFDGNGRVGRSLILIVLRRRRVATTCLPPVSLVLAGEADRYVAGLTSWRTGGEEDWYVVFVDALFRAATGAREFAARVADLQRRWIEKAGNPRKGSGALRLIELLPSQPIVNVKTAAELLGGTEERARLAIRRLEDAGVLRQTSVGRRNRAWECVGLFDQLDRFERELGPQGRTPRPTR